jgi:hypothetical protein
MLEKELMRTLWRPNPICGRMMLLEIRVSQFCKKAPVIHTNQPAVQGGERYKSLLEPGNPRKIPPTPAPPALVAARGSPPDPEAPASPPPHRPRSRACRPPLLHLSRRRAGHEVGPTGHELLPAGHDLLPAGDERVPDAMSSFPPATTSSPTPRARSRRLRPPPRCHELLPAGHDLLPAGHDLLPAGPSSFPAATTSFSIWMEPDLLDPVV